MEQKTYPITKQDLYLQYKRETGNYPEDLTEYKKWLEEELIKHIELKRKLIPWEPLNE